MLREFWRKVGKLLNLPLVKKIFFKKTKTTQNVQVSPSSTSNLKGRVDSGRSRGSTTVRTNVKLGPETNLDQKFKFEPKCSGN